MFPKQQRLRPVESCRRSLTIPSRLRLREKRQRRRRHRTQRHMFRAGRRRRRPRPSYSGTDPTGRRSPRTGGGRCGRRRGGRQSGRGRPEGKEEYFRNDVLLPWYRQRTSIWTTVEESPRALSTAAVPQRSRAPDDPGVAAGVAGGGHEEEEAAGWEDDVDAVDRLAAPWAWGDAPRLSLSATAL